MTEAQLWSSKNATVDYLADDILREKGRALYYDKAPIPTDNGKRQETLQRRPNLPTNRKSCVIKMTPIL